MTDYTIGSIYQRPADWTLGHFATARTMFPGAKRWETITGWQRQGLVSIRPLSKDHVTVELTERGRKEAGV